MTEHAQPELIDRSKPVYPQPGADERAAIAAITQSAKQPPAYARHTKKLGVFAGAMASLALLNIWIAPNPASHLSVALMATAGLAGAVSLFAGPRHGTARRACLSVAGLCAIGSLALRGMAFGGASVEHAQGAIALLAGGAILMSDFSQLWIGALMGVTALTVAGLGAESADIGMTAILALLPVLAGAARWSGPKRRTGDRDLNDEFALNTLELPGVDLLTGAGSRKLFDAELAMAFEGDPGTNVAVLLIDADYFKAFNTQHGYQAGDRCLAAMARTMQQQLRADIDLLARYHGSEFAVLLPGADLGDSARVAERIRRAIEDLAIPHGGPDMPILTVSIGFSAAPRGLSRPERLINAADASLYAAKQAGRNRIAPQLVRPGYTSEVS